MAATEKKNSAIQSAMKMLEHVFTTYSNSKAHESNKYPLGDPNRVEADLREIEKSHLALLQRRGMRNTGGRVESSHWLPSTLPVTRLHLCADRHC